MIACTINNVKEYANNSSKEELFDLVIKTYEEKKVPINDILKQINNDKKLKLKHKIDDSMNYMLSMAIHKKVYDSYKVNDKYYALIEENEEPNVEEIDDSHVIKDMYYSQINNAIKDSINDLNLTLSGTENEKKISFTLKSDINEQGKLNILGTINEKEVKLTSSSTVNGIVVKYKDEQYNQHIIELDEKSIKELTEKINNINNELSKKFYIDKVVKSKFEYVKGSDKINFSFDRTRDEMFDALEPNSINDYIDELVDLDNEAGVKYDDEYIEDLKTVMDYIGNNIYGYKVLLEEGNKLARGAIAINLKKIYVKLSKSIKDGDTTNTEAFTHELIHAATDIAIESKDPKMQGIINQIQKIHEHVFDNMKPEDLILGTKTDEAIANATRKYNYLKGDLKEFIAMSVTNPALIKYLKNQNRFNNINEDDSIWKQMLGYVKTIYQNLYDVYNGNSIVNMYDEMMTSVVAMSFITNNIDMNKNEHVSYIGEMNDFVSGIVKGGLDKAKEKLAEYTDTANLGAFGTTVKFIFNENYRNFKIDTMIEVLEENWNFTPLVETLKLVQGLSLDLSARDKTFRKFENLNLVSNNIDQEIEELKKYVGSDINQVLDVLDEDEKQQSGELIMYRDITVLDKNDLTDGIERYEKIFSKQELKEIKAYAYFLQTGGIKESDKKWFRFSKMKLMMYKNETASKLATLYSLKKEEYPLVEKILDADKDGTIKKSMEIVKKYTDTKGYIPPEFNGTNYLVLNDKNELETRINIQDIDYRKQGVRYTKWRHKLPFFKQYEESEDWHIPMTSKNGTYIGSVVPVERNKIREQVSIKEDVAGLISTIVVKEADSAKAYIMNKKIIDAIVETNLESKIEDDKYVHEDMSVVITGKEPKYLLFSHIEVRKQPGKIGVEGRDYLYSEDEQIANALKIMPFETKQYMIQKAKEYAKKTNQKGNIILPVRKDLRNMIFGYRRMSLSNLATNKKLKSSIRYLEKLWQDLVQIKKIDIIIKTPAVLQGNIVSNFIQGLQMGISPAYIAKTNIAAIKGLASYLETNDKIKKLQVKKALSGLTKAEEGKLKFYKQYLEKNIVKKMIDKGFYMPMLEEFNVNEDNKNIIEQKLQDLRKKYIGDNIVNDGLDLLYITDKTETYKMITRAIQLSDFIQRYTTIEYLQAYRKKSFDKAAEIALDQFINYENPDSRLLDYFNSFGLVMFTKYFARIQRVIRNGILRNPMTMGAYEVIDEKVHDFDDITDQSLISKNYSAIFHNPIKDFESLITPPAYEEVVGMF